MYYLTVKDENYLKSFLFFLKDKFHFYSFRYHFQM